MCAEPVMNMLHKPSVVEILWQAIILIQLTQTTSLSHCLMLLSNFNVVSAQKVRMGN